MSITSAGLVPEAPRQASKAALIVALVFTTTTSPAARKSGKCRNRACPIESSTTRLTSRRTPSRVRPRASGGSRAANELGSSKATIGLPCFYQNRPQVRRDVPSARKITLQQGDEAGDADLCQRPITDVFTRISGLMHV